MGLLLSILVACVGVVELLAFYSNVTRSFVTTCTWTELTDLNRRYLEEFEKHKKNISVSNYNGVSSSEKIKTEFNESVVKSNSPSPSFRRFLLIGEGAQSSSILENGKQISSAEEILQTDFISTDQKAKPESPITDAEDAEKPRSRSPSPIPKRLGEQEAFRRSPSPYPSLVLPVLRKSICSELLDNPTISVVEVDEELLSRTPTPERIDQILESNNIKTQYSSNQILEVPSRTRFCSVDLKANNQPQVPQPESDFALKDLDRPTQNANENDEDVKEYDEQFLDSLDGVKKKKIGRSGASRRSKKKKITAKSPSNNDAQIAKTLTEAANVLKNVNRRADGPSEKPGTSKDGGSKTAAPFW
ncbi:uncharacterized protein BDFB_004157, partial [Asbolus verrucosus]